MNENSGLQALPLRGMPVESKPVPFRQTGKFSPLFCDYAEKKSCLDEYHAGFPDQHQMERVISERCADFPAEQRKLLHRILTEQTCSVKHHAAQETSLHKIAVENCLTVSCGHQLCLGGGPQYMLLKILTTIRLAEDLQHQFPEQRFVPVFWLAGEDHDIDEIRQLQFFGKKYQVDVPGSGACGRLGTNGIAAQLREIPDFPEAMIQAYESSADVGEATRKWLHHYFGDRGLLVLDADCRELKDAFLPEMLEEFKGPALADNIRRQTQRLEAMGYGAQLHCRDLNLFFLDDNIRIRLEKSTSGIRTANGQREWTVEDAMAYFSSNPEKLSPNACLRPLYSQKILPDIAFIGGPAEIAYWLQLKTAFELRKIHFPMLIPRFSALILPQNRFEKLDKLGINASELFADVPTLRKKIALGEGSIPEPEIRQAFQALLAFAANIDSGITASLEADLSRMEDQTANMIRKVRKAAEKKEETRLRQLDQLIEFCFPAGGMLERSESWLSLMLQFPELPEQIYREISSTDFRFFILKLSQ